ncbi:hypothetical protein [Nannocystis pusilla]|uniref:hypothetical protein n=1 Tax=Nannocystis pusilla TaxID=889268 RepID=UPI003B78BE0E
MPIRSLVASALFAVVASLGCNFIMNPDGDGVFRCDNPDDCDVPLADALSDKRGQSRCAAGGGGGGGFTQSQDNKVCSVLDKEDVSCNPAPYANDDSVPVAKAYNDALDEGAAYSCAQELYGSAGCPPNGSTCNEGLELRTYETLSGDAENPEQTEVRVCAPKGVAAVAGNSAVRGLTCSTSTAARTSATTRSCATAAAAPAAAGAASAATPTRPTATAAAAPCTCRAPPRRSTPTTSAATPATTWPRPTRPSSAPSSPPRSSTRSPGRFGYAPSGMSLRTCPSGHVATGMSLRTRCSSNRASAPCGSVSAEARRSLLPRARLRTGPPRAADRARRWRGFPALASSARLAGRWLALLALPDMSLQPARCCSSCAAPRCSPPRRSACATSCSRPARSPPSPPSCRPSRPSCAASTTSAATA